MANKAGQAHAPPVDDYLAGMPPVGGWAAAGTGLPDLISMIPPERPGRSGGIMCFAVVARWHTARLRARMAGGPDQAGWRCAFA